MAICPFFNFIAVYQHFFFVLTYHEKFLVCFGFIYDFDSVIHQVIDINPCYPHDYIEHVTRNVGVLGDCVFISILNNLQTLKNDVVILIHQLVEHLCDEVHVRLLTLLLVPLFLQFCNSPETHRRPTHRT